MFLSQEILEMYLFSFNKFAWHDRVFSTSLSVWKPWDLIRCWSEFLLNLWDEISFPELVRTQFTPTTSREVIYKWFFDPKFLELLHWMTYWRYSTYNNVLKLFVSFDIDALLNREAKIKPQNKDINIPNKECINKMHWDKQNLVIIPDNRSRFNQLSDFFSQDYVTHLYSIDTQNRKDQHRWEIKKSKTWIIVATQSEIFQPFKNLGSVTFIDWFKWYYNNQQDPRYSVWAIVKKLQEIWWCDIININNVWLI